MERHFIITASVALMGIDVCKASIHSALIILHCQRRRRGGAQTVVRGPQVVHGLLLLVILVFFVCFTVKIVVELNSNTSCTSYLVSLSGVAQL